MVTKVRGAFNEFEGSGVVDGGTDLTRSTGQLTMQAASIDTRNEQCECVPVSGPHVKYALTARLAWNTARHVGQSEPLTESR
jgi:polyisoprenoid-binding protein YceI